jgi:hypothetical protein
MVWWCKPSWNTIIRKKHKTFFSPSHTISALILFPRVIFPWNRHKGKCNSYLVLSKSFRLLPSSTNL